MAGGVRAVRWFVWAPDENTRDEAVVYDEMFAYPAPLDTTGDAYQHWLESTAARYAETYAEVKYYDDGPDASLTSYNMNVAAVGDDDVEVALFEYVIYTEFDPTFSAKRTNVKK